MEKDFDNLWYEMSDDELDDFFDYYYNLDEKRRHRWSEMSYNRYSGKSRWDTRNFEPEENLLDDVL